MIQLALDDGGAMPALHLPAAAGGGPGKPLLLIHETLGINTAFRKVAARWASFGFEVLCPDFFSRLEAGVALEPNRPGDAEMAVERLMRLDMDRAILDLAGACRWLLAHTGDPAVSAIGYCIGGRLVVRLAMEAPIAAAVSYYGIGLEALLPVAPRPMARCLLHIAGNDAFASAEARREVLARSAGLAGVTTHVYPDAGHAFAREGENFDLAATRLAEARTLEWLA